MVWPLPVDDPRDDVRLPTYYKGNRFGPVPRTRVRIWFPLATTGIWEWLNPGIIIQAEKAGDDPTATNLMWYEGTFEYAGWEWRAIYQANQAGYPSNTPTQFSVTVLSEGSTLWRADRNPNQSLAGNDNASLFINQIGGSPPALIVKSFVYEWNRPSERWPGVIITDP